LAERALAWNWHPRDLEDAFAYSKKAEIEHFERVALPQGLVAAGFFANLVLLDFDRAMAGARQTQPVAGIEVVDYCRYVDDLRIVARADRTLTLSQIEDGVYSWLSRTLIANAFGLEISREKTRAVQTRGDERNLVRQSRKMARIQGAISGGFDAIGGAEILDAVQGLLRSQEQHPPDRSQEAWRFSPVADVRDATVGRFAAARYRRIYRSLRPMLPDDEEASSAATAEADEPLALEWRGYRTQKDLDEEVRAFALGLVETWTLDPSNVRLLRIGLDLWPSAELISEVLSLLRPFTIKGGQRKAPRKVALYCLAEIFRAGATETGLVEDPDELPAAVDLGEYRKVLKEEAVRLSLIKGKLPWYLRQQVLLFIAACDPTAVEFPRRGKSLETAHYREAIRFLKGEQKGLSAAEFSIAAILSRRSFLSATAAVNLTIAGLSVRRLEEIAERDHAFALEIIARDASFEHEISPRLRDDLCLSWPKEHVFPTLAKIVMSEWPRHRLRNELSMLSFVVAFMKSYIELEAPEVITPVDVLLDIRVGASEREITLVDAVTILNSRVGADGSVYMPPLWCPRDQRWRFQLGFLLRFLLTSRQDVTRSVAVPSWREQANTYRAGAGHWYARIYGLFSGHSAYGDDWLPITEWSEWLMSALLRWPGQRHMPGFEFVEGEARVALGVFETRLASLDSMRGSATGMLFPVLSAKWPVKPEGVRPLRVCVVQTVIPNDLHISPSDLNCSKPLLRKRHRRHLSAALAAIERMLDLRETHSTHDRRLDWLILPELSVHPDDVETHLVPFSRAHKTIILAGLTFEEIFIGQPLVNSALWIVPVLDGANGLQIRKRRQGKQHLAQVEEAINAAGGPHIQSFRPCQWIVGYQWSKSDCQRPLMLTGAICYDATDLALAADLKQRSDIFAIPALNIDVGTFDQMALALHYHMFQSMRPLIRVFTAAS